MRPWAPVKLQYTRIKHVLFNGIATKEQQQKPGSLCHCIKHALQMWQVRFIDVGRPKLANPHMEFGYRCYNISIASCSIQTRYPVRK